MQSTEQTPGCLSLSLSVKVSPKCSLSQPLRLGSLGDTLLRTGSTGHRQDTPPEGRQGGRNGLEPFY